MALLEQVDQLSIKQRLMVLGVVVVLLLVGFYYWIYAPNAKTISGLRMKLSSVQSDLQGLRAINAKLPEFKAQSEGLQKQLLEMRKKLPQDKEIPGLLDSISKAGTESGLQFELFRPRAENKKEFYSEVPVDITVTGPFHAISMFLDKVVHFPRIVNISNFNFGSAKEVGGYLMVTGTGVATTYRYNEKN